MLNAHKHFALIPTDRPNEQLNEWGFLQKFCARYGSLVSECIQFCTYIKAPHTVIMNYVPKMNIWQQQQQQQRCSVLCSTISTVSFCSILIKGFVIFLCFLFFLFLFVSLGRIVNATANDGSDSDTCDGGVGDIFGSKIILPVACIDPCISAKRSVSG